MAGHEYMVIADRAGKVYRIERQTLIRGSLELEAKGVPIGTMRADEAARLVLEHLLRQRGVARPD
jgi:hypothetical protein